ncbi:embryonic polyadenylate-binding protein 2 isoform X2 [Sapajus apella]|uniref:Embryonic polyadenylate-binding protein 2 isoform X2 n=1 Tax=Sapajus apella TaxID=9515 RepID=A0A6J3IDZ7_SAPAP|nr:embryonic polyadenylate-binding protein 2 isoform X2 [Sapajus apella]
MWCLCRVVSVPCGCCLGVNLGTDAGSRELQCGWAYAEETNQLHSASPSSRESPRGACPRDRERQGPRSQGWKLSRHSAFANGPVGAAGLWGRLKTPAGPRQVRTREEWREASPGPPSSCPSTMWPVQSCSLFPPPTQAWLQTVSSDPEAQGWGAWNKTKNSLEPEGGEGKEEREGEAEEDQDGDEGFLLSLLEQESLAEFPMPDQELEAIKMKVWAMEQAEGLPQPPGAQRREEEDAVAGQLLSPEAAGHPIPGTPEEKVEADHRSVYVGNVDYGGSAEELEAHFSCCGKVYRVTILCDKFSGHPKGYAYIEFATKGSVQAAMQLDQSLFRGRVIKVLPKRTNFPGISSTDRGGLRGHPGSRGAPFPHSSLQGRPRFRPRGQNQARGRVSPWFSPY